MFQEAVETIVVVDFGGQYAHLIARRVRSCGVYSKILEPEQFYPDREPALKGVILSGGPRSVTDEDLLALPFDIAQLKVPVLGLCYGHQLIAQTLGGQVDAGIQREYGLTRVDVHPGGFLAEGMDPLQDVWMSHGDHVTRLPQGFRVTHSSPSVPVAGFENEDQTVFGLQFHPEVTHTRNGMVLIERFVRRCAPERSWDPGSIVEHLIESVRQEAGDRHLFLLASGGVDSLVALVLCIKALGNHRVTSLHVDTGFMRHQESKEVMKHLEAMGFQNLHVVHAGPRFFEALQGVVDPEKKRKIIGRLFVEEVNRSIAGMELPENWVLVQGTIYPDTIESGGTKHASTIKTHHNRVDEIQKMIDAGRIIEPIRELYKDEVREAGMQLGLPHHLVHRHPFPGPGLAIRILCSDGIVPEDYQKEQSALTEILTPLGLAGRILPVFSVGVQGDFRTYHHPAVVWWTGDSPSWDRLLTATSQVVNRLSTVNRVVYSAGGGFDDLACGLRPTTLTLDVVAKLQEVDLLVRTRTAQFDEIWQVPVVSLPLLDNAGNRFFLQRPVCSRDAMTASPFQMDFAFIQQLEGEARSLSGVAGLWYDVTDKPPGTIEWE